MKLRPLQENFQNYLLDQSSEILTHVKGNSRADTKTMLGVYHYAYKARLVECLASDFPNLGAFMGREEFIKMGHAYILAYPSRTPSVRWLGRHLARFLAEHSPYRESVILKDLAAFEWAIAHAFDAKDETQASLSDMAIVPPESWASLKLRFHPSLQHLVLESEAVALREAIIADQDVTDISREKVPSCYWWVWRQDLEVKYHRAAEDEAACLRLMRDDEGDFGAMCDELIPYVGEERASFRAAEILRAWLDWGMVADIKYDTQASLA